LTDIADEIPFAKAGLKYYHTVPTSNIQFFGICDPYRLPQILWQAERIFCRQDAKTPDLFLDFLAT
jgi:hypothetical protein